MSHSEKYPVPVWVAPEERTEFALRLAALFHNKSGSLSDLSTAIGGSHSKLHMALRTKGGVSAQDCIQIETLLGRETMPREFIRPDLFVPAE